MTQTIKKSACIVTILVIAVWIGTGFAEEPVEILPIKPVPYFEAGESGIAGFDEAILHGRGWIQRIEDNEVVVSDVLFPFSAEISYYDMSTGLPASSSQFVVGTLVGYCLSKKREIVAFYLLAYE